MVYFPISRRCGPDSNAPRRSDWCRKNLKRGALLEDLLKTLTTKGFHPAKNPGFMEKFLLIRSWAYAFGEPFPPQEKVRPEPVYPEIVSRVQFDDGVVDRVRKDFDQSKKLSTVPEHVEVRDSVYVEATSVDSSRRWRLRVSSSPPRYRRGAMLTRGGSRRRPCHTGVGRFAIGRRLRRVYYLGSVILGRAFFRLIASCPT